MMRKTVARSMIQGLSCILIVMLVSCNLPIATVATEEPAVIQNPANINIDSHQWYVAVDGDDNNDCHSLAHPCQYITTAVERASDGDSIRIGAGTFYENIRVTKSLTFMGQGMDVTIIDGNGTQTLDEVFWFDGESITPGPINAILSDMTIQNGDCDDVLMTNYGKWRNGDGGGIHAVDTNLVLNNIRVTGNSAHRSGGGIYFSNSVSKGGIEFTLEITNSFIENNVTNADGGGLYVDGYFKVTITDTVISNNDAPGFKNEYNTNYDVSGGGLYLDAHATLTRVVVENNHVALPSAAGGINSLDEIKIFDSAIKDNAGAGLHVNDAEIYNSTISGSEGTGIIADGNLHIENSTISNNLTFYDYSDNAGLVATGILDGKKLTTNHVTIANNGGAGFRQNNNTQIEMMNTLIAQNTVNCANPNGRSSTSAFNGSYNISTDGTCGTDHFTVVADAMIGPLQDNGGSTMTHALLFGSPAIDTGRDGLDLDQRGVTRPQDGDGDGKKHVDIGAYEYERDANQVVFIPNLGLNCRSGPSAAYQVIGYADQGHSYAVEGRNEDSSWVYIRQTGDLRCWVSAGNGALSGDVATVEVVTVAPVTPMDISTDIPPAACSSFTAATCPSYCKIGHDPSGAQICVNK